MMNKTKSLGFFMFAVFAAVLVVASASAVDIFIDNFQDGDLSGWTVTNNPSPLPSSGTGWTNTGTFVEAKPGADGTDGTSTLEKTISTANLQNIVIQYSRQLKGFEPADEFSVSWSTDGSNYTNVEETLNTTPDDPSFVSKTFNLLASANNNQNFRIRFICTTSAQSDEFCRLDNVAVTGDAVATSASFTLTQITPITQTQNGVIRVTNNGNVALTNIQLTDTGDFNVDFTPSSIPSLAVGATQDVTVTATNLGSVGFEGKSVTVTAVSGTVTKTIVLHVTGSFCKSGQQGGNLSIDRVKVDNNGDGKDDEWQLLDTIEVEVKVENNGNDDVDDVFVELGLFDSSGRNRVGDLDFNNADEEEFDIGRIRDGDDETITFEFDVPADFEDGSYKLTVKTYSDDLGESNECDDTSSDLSNDNFEAIDVERETDEGKFIAFDNFVMSPTEATCNERAAITFDVLNIGDEDQDRVRIRLTGTELGIEQQLFEITNDLDQGDRESVTMEFVVPRDATDKTYSLRLSADYDYKSGSYRETSDDETLFPFKVLGCAATGGTGTSERIGVIGVDSGSVTFTGNELTVRATVASQLSENARFLIDANDFESWASLNSVSPNFVELEPGQSKEVTLRFNVNEDASGEQSFVVEISANGQSQTREVSVDLGAGTGSSGRPSFNFGDNAYLWIIGIVNVVLIILIIVVAVRISRR